MLNTLANHNFLPHDGKDITREQTADALFNALNVNKTLGSFLFDFALRTSPKANASTPTFSLNNLGNHNILEHDASLSRPDAFNGNALAFNQTIFDETRSYWTADIINIEMAAKARLARIKTSAATNPTYQLSELGSQFAFGESVAYVLFMGDKTSATANRSWVEWFFEHERLPVHFGWKRPPTLFQENDLTRYMGLIQNITKGLGDVKPVALQPAKRIPTHFGF
jgi:hypothetical protein